MATRITRNRAEISKQAYGTTMDMGRAIKCARLASGINTEYISKCIGTPLADWVDYEHNRKPVPGYILIKLMIFGMDFWARNKSCFEETTTDTPSAGADTPLARGEVITNN